EVLRLLADVVVPPAVPGDVLRRGLVAFRLELRLEAGPEGGLHRPAGGAVRGAQGHGAAELPARRAGDAPERLLGEARDQSLRLLERSHGALRRAPHHHELADRARGPADLGPLAIRLGRVADALRNPTAEALRVHLVNRHRGVREELAHRELAVFG